MKDITILGSTGSIGVNTIKILTENLKDIKVSGLSANNNYNLLCKQAEMLRPRAVCIYSEIWKEEVKRQLKGKNIAVLSGEEGLCELVSMQETDRVLSAVVGTVGIKPAYYALEKKKTLLLANKEALVSAGPLMMECAKKNGVEILPVDSEHSAIFQCLQGEKKKNVRRLLITASGGPFRETSVEKLKTVKVSQALKHPNWDMGGKITIDSATLMNKGLEVIEAHYLFDIPYENIEVVIHPQSIIHSMIEMVDHSVLAQMGVPDMRVPIQYALTWPDRNEMNNPDLIYNPFLHSKMEFFPARTEAFSCLNLAYESGKKGGTYPAVMNAANEVAVYAFMAEKISFLEIPEIIGKVLSMYSGKTPHCIEDILIADAFGRKTAEDLIC